MRVRHIIATGLLILACAAPLYAQTSYRQVPAWETETKAEEFAAWRKKQEPTPGCDPIMCDKTKMSSGRSAAAVYADEVAKGRGGYYREPLPSLVQPRITCRTSTHRRFGFYTTYTTCD